MIGTVVVVLLLAVSTASAAKTNTRCYRHWDPAAKYQMQHEKGFYPTQEINLILEEHPEMKSMFSPDDSPLPVPASSSLPAPQPACPYDRYTLYSFFHSGKDCYVIYPDVQKISYVQCNGKYDRDCQQCTGYGGVSKCEEDFDYRHVWAYCIHRPAVARAEARLKPVVARPNPVVVRPDPVVTRPKPVVVKPQVIPPVVLNSNSNPQPGPVFPMGSDQKPWYNNPHMNPAYLPRHEIRSIGDGYLEPSWGKIYRPYIVQQRWKRSYHQKDVKGEIERMQLYLPHHCGCKRFVC